MNFFFKVVSLILLGAFLLIYVQNAANGRYIAIEQAEGTKIDILDTRNGTLYYVDPSGHWTKTNPIKGLLPAQK